MKKVTVKVITELFKSQGSEIIIPEEYTSLDANSFIKFSKRNRITSITLPRTIDIIESDTFINMQNLRYISAIGVKVIKMGSFQHLPNLEEVKFNPLKFPKVSPLAFDSSCYDLKFNIGLQVINNLIKLYEPKNIIEWIVSEYIKRFKFRGLSFGLCNEIDDELNEVVNNRLRICRKKELPLFNEKNAIEYANGKSDFYWWGRNKKGNLNRLKFLKWIRNEMLK